MQTNLATLSYNANALPSQLTFQTSTGTSGLANEQFSYDAICAQPGPMRYG